jgi:hypothetical protein
MATTRKTLGRTTTTAGGDATLYTVPGATDAVVSSIVVAETGGAAATFKVCTDSGGSTATAAARAVAFNVPLAANQVIVLALGLTLAAASTIVVSGSTTTVTFSAFGQENT